VTGARLAADRPRAISWSRVQQSSRTQGGLEHLILARGSSDGVVIAFDDAGEPFRLAYRLRWNDAWQIGQANLEVSTADGVRSLDLHSDGEGNWRSGSRSLVELDGCLDLDIWPTPFTNTFPIRRVAFEVGERKEFRMAWISAPELTVRPQAQAYTRIAERTYLFESLDGSGFAAELNVDEDGVVLDYPGLFRRLGTR
jgi:hypothetical protein